MYDVTPRSPRDDEGFFQEWWTTVRVTWRLLLDRRVELAVKLIPLLAFVYLISPFDFLPDVVPMAGQLDDVAIILLALRLFLHLAPPDLVAHYRVQVAERDAVDAEWRRIDPEGRS
ncbi:MAG: YkvA family protein [Ardenticatenaceae bacterium]|nr:YkvA family protein [Ardenticatenaceae bacterium]